MRKIILATTNDRKVREANETLAPFDLIVEPIAIDIDEIQHHDSAEIAKAKAKAAFDVLQKPVAVQDTSWEIPALGGFPGGYMKDIAGWFVPEDWVGLMSRHEDKTIFCVEHVAYTDGKEISHFQFRYAGKFVDAPRGEDGDSLDKMVVVSGDKTMAELHDVRELATQNMKLGHWEQFARWYAKRKE